MSSDQSQWWFGRLQASRPRSTWPKVSKNWTRIYNNSRDTGTLTVVKSLSPANDPGLFNLQIDGATAGDRRNVGNGGTTGAQTVNTGTHTVGETAGTRPPGQLHLLDRCKNGATGTNSGPLNVSISKSADVTCTITNTRNKGTIEVVKDLIPSTDPGQVRPPDRRLDRRTGAASVTAHRRVQCGRPRAPTRSARPPARAPTSPTTPRSIACTNGASGSGSGPLNVEHHSNGNVIAARSPTRADSGTIQVVKDLIPSTDPGSSTSRSTARPQGRRRR